jgi:hypothetical protein
MKSHSFDTTVELGEVEVEVTVKYNFSHGAPGKTDGLPENCYPAEGPEVEIEVVYLIDDKAKTDVLPKLAPDVVERLEEIICDSEEDAYNDAYERAMEDAADAAREREWDR